VLLVTSQLTEPGPVVLINDPSLNLSGAIFEGLDYEAIYILDSTIFGGGDWGRLTTTVNGTWLSRAEFQAAADVKRVGIAGEFLPPAFTLTSSLPWHRANFSIFYDGPADTWMQGLDVGAVVHWIGQYNDDNASLTGSPKLNMPITGGPGFSGGFFAPTTGTASQFPWRARKVAPYTTLDLILNYTFNLPPPCTSRSTWLCQGRRQKREERQGRQGEECRPGIHGRVWLQATGNGGLTTPQLRWACRT
jgi:outer membrane receptor protein involved in Fe transport